MTARPLLFEAMKQSTSFHWTIFRLTPEGWRILTKKRSGKLYRFPSMDEALKKFNSMKTWSPATHCINGI